MCTFSKSRGPASTRRLRRGGFTLIEVMVSVMIFSVVMTVALGALLAMSQSDQRAEALKSVVNNLNFALDSMTRTIRTGYSYDCGATGAAHDCPPPTSAPSLAFVPASNVGKVYYRFDVSAGVCGQTGIIGCVSRSTDGINWYALTSPDVVIKNLQFIVIGSTPGDFVQPKVTMLISGTYTISPTQISQFNLETSVTQRIYDQ